MHCLTLKERVPTRPQPGSAAGPIAPPARERAAHVALDSQTDWPTHRLRWCLSLFAPLDRRGGR